MSVVQNIVQTPRQMVVEELASSHTGIGPIIQNANCDFKNTVLLLKSEFEKLSQKVDESFQETNKNLKRIERGTTRFDGTLGCKDNCMM